MTLKFDGWSRKVIGQLFHITSSFVHHLKSLGEFKPELLSGNAQFGSKSMIFCPVWPWNLMDDLEKQQSISSMLHEALCIISKPSVNSNWSYSPEMLNFGSKSAIFLSRVTLKFDGWPWKTIGHLFYVATSFMHHFIAIGESKLIYSPEALNSGQNRRFFVLCDLEIWWMTLKNNRTPFLCYFKLCCIIS